MPINMKDSAIQVSACNAASVQVLLHRLLAFAHNGFDVLMAFMLKLT
jgi:hypothetical protein